MEELYAEGLATHGGPESCVDDLRGRGEALTGVRAGRAIEPRNLEFGVPTLYLWRKATSPGAFSRVAGGPRAVGEPEHVRQSPSARTGRSHGRPAWVVMPRPGWFAGWHTGR